MDEQLRGDARDAVEVKLTLGGHCVDMTADADAVRELRKVFVRVGQSGSTAIYGHIVLPSGPVGRVHGIEVALRNGCDMRKASDEARARARIHEAEALLKKTAVSADEDEGLREGRFVGCGSQAGIATPPSISEMKRRKAFAEALISYCKAMEGFVSVEDWIRTNCPDAERSDTNMFYGHILLPHDQVARVHTTAGDLERIEVALRDACRLEKAYEKARTREHAAELRAERAERRVAILERAASAEFEWEGCVDVGTPEVPHPVRIRTTEAGFEAMETGLGRLRREADEASVRAACADEVARALDVALKRYETTTKAIARLATEAA